MRKIDEQKKLKIKAAVIDLVEQNGLTNLTTAKVAQTAGVSPATLYIYYQDKTDMLSRIYESVKDELHAGLLVTLAAAPSDLTAQLRTMLQFSVTQDRRQPRAAQFVQTLWTNPESLDAAARQHGTELDSALGQLFAALVVDDHYAALSRDAFELFLSMPSQLLLRRPDVSEPEITHLIEVVIKAVQQ